MPLGNKLIVVRFFQQLFDIIRAFRLFQKAAECIVA